VMPVIMRSWLANGSETALETMEDGFGRSIHSMMIGLTQDFSGNSRRVYPKIALSGSSGSNCTRVDTFAEATHPSTT